MVIVADILLVKMKPPILFKMGHKMAGFLSIPMTEKELNSENRPTSAGLDAGPERPKSVLSSHLWGIAYPLHLVALASTVAMLQLSFRKVYYADVGTNGLLGGLIVNEAPNAIQVAAKFMRSSWSRPWLLLFPT